jgi:predicted methyltransferase
MVEIVNKNKEVIGDTVNWQAKYQELLEKYNKIAYQRP